MPRVRRQATRVSPSSLWELARPPHAPLQAARGRARRLRCAGARKTVRTPSTTSAQLRGAEAGGGGGEPRCCAAARHSRPAQPAAARAHTQPLLRRDSCRRQRSAREEDCRRAPLYAPRRPSRHLPALSLTSHPSLPPLSVFLSGGGSNFKALHAAMLDGRIRGRVVAVVSDKPECGGAGYAREHGVPVLRYPAPRDQPSEGLSSAALVQELQERGTELVLLAGYLRLVPPELCRAFPRALLNIHPALLPAFGGKGMYGGRVHAAVIASGARCVLPLFFSFSYISRRRRVYPAQLQRADGALRGRGVRQRRHRRPEMRPRAGRRHPRLARPPGAGAGAARAKILRRGCVCADPESPTGVGGVPGVCGGAVRGEGEVEGGRGAVRGAMRGRSFMCPRPRASVRRLLGECNVKCNGA